MSTLDPGLEPPGDWQNAYAPQDPGPNPAGGKAATYLWLSAGLQLLLSCCCGLTGLGLMLMSAAEVMENMPRDIPNREEALRMLPYMGPIMAIGSVVLLFLPALVLGILAFPVRSGGRAASIAALVILTIQCLGLAMMILNYLIALMTFQSFAILFILLVMGAIMALFVKTGIELINVLRHPTPTDLSQDGW